MEDPRARLLELIANEDFNLPDDLTEEKIEERGYDFKYTREDKISFTIERHPPLFGRQAPKNMPSPARWHVITDYTYDLELNKWDIQQEDPEFDYDIHLLVEYEIMSLGEGNAIYNVIKNGGPTDTMVDSLIDGIVEYYNEVPKTFDISEEQWKMFVNELRDGLKPRIAEEISRLSG